VFDCLFLREAGFNVKLDRVDCTVVRAALIDESLLSYSLDSLSKKYLSEYKDTDIYQELAAIFGGGANANAQAKNFPDAPIELMARYAKQDTRVTLKLWEWQEREIRRQELHKVVDLECRLFEVILDMERRGVRVDTDQALMAVDTMTDKIDEMQDYLNNMAGFPVNPNPSNSIKQLFQPIIQRNGTWKLIDGTIVESTPGGKAQINSDVLRIMTHPAAKSILSLRKMLKTRDTFLLGHILGNHHNGIIHCNYNQTKSMDGNGTNGTGTGRISVNAPALQQIHKRDTEIASIVRSLFLPDKDQIWVCNDYSQADFRVMAHYVNDPGINARYTEDPDTDFHGVVADMTGLPRSPRFAGDPSAKQTNLSLTFGQGMGSFAKELGLPFTERTSGGHTYLKAGEEAEAIFSKYHTGIPGIKLMLDNASKLARIRGYVTTIMGRKIRFPNGYKAYKAGGLIFQGTAADILKVKMIEIHNLLKGTDARLMLTIHDEYAISCPTYQSELLPEITNCLENFTDCDIKLRVPFRSTQGSGPTWWDACK
jgi:DNA polymerase I-like protein with 3'-5' exonuclease and polymerase domains